MTEKSLLLPCAPSREAESPFAKWNSLVAPISRNGFLPCGRKSEDTPKGCVPVPTERRVVVLPMSRGEGECPIVPREEERGTHRPVPCERDGESDACRGGACGDRSRLVVQGRRGDRELGGTLRHLFFSVRHLVAVHIGDALPELVVHARLADVLRALPEGVRYLFCLVPKLEEVEGVGGEAGGCGGGSQCRVLPPFGRTPKLKRDDEGET